MAYLRSRRVLQRQSRTSRLKAAVAMGEVQVQQTVRLDFTLTVGQISESVEVARPPISCPGKRHGWYRDWKQGYR